MRRREFVTVLGGAAAALPRAARAQQQRGNIARIGFLGATSASAPQFASRLGDFRLGLRELGYVEDSNLSIESRWADDNYNRLPVLAAELFRSNVDVILTHGTPGSLAAKRATTTIPIVIASIGDPVAAGIVPSLARPAGNITGLSFFSPEISAKKIEVLKEIIPQLTRVAVLLNTDNPASVGPMLQMMQVAAESLKVRLDQFPARRAVDFERAFEQMHQEQIVAVVIDDDAFFSANHVAIAMLAAKHRLLSVGLREFAQAGGLIGYGANLSAMYRRAAALVDKILKGTKPADIPIEQATKFDFVVNLKTAKALGIDLPTATLLRANEVIE